MSIEIRDAELENMIQQQLKITGASSVEELLRKLFAEKQAQQDQERWLTENREEIRAKIQRGLDELDRGEGIPDYKARQYIANLRSKKR